MKPVNDVTMCRSCGGRGYYPTRFGHVSTRCEECDGTGQVTADSVTLQLQPDKLEEFVKGLSEFERGRVRLLLNTTNPVEEVAFQSSMRYSPLVEAHEGKAQKRDTFTIPEGWEAEVDAYGRSTGRLIPEISPRGALREAEQGKTPAGVMKAQGKVLFVERDRIEGFDREEILLLLRRIDEELGNGLPFTLPNLTKRFKGLFRSFLPEVWRKG